MKRLIAAISFALLAVPAAARADVADTTKVSGTWVNGVKGGVNVSTMGGGLDNTSSHIGAGVGYFFSYRVGNGIAVQPELIVMERGAETVVLAENGRDADLIATYIDVPILARYNVPLQGDFRPYVIAGPALSLKIDARRMIGSDGTDYDDETKLFDFGAHAGAGCDWALGKNTGIALEARYSIGFTNVLDDGSDDNVKNRTFSVLFGIWR
jgi:opacity protein-like surface antigen